MFNSYCVNGRQRMEGQCRLAQYIMARDIVLLKNLLCEETIVDIFVDINLNTPLHMATVANSYQMVDLLLQAGASVNVKNKDGDTPLHKASGGTHFELVELLLERGASVNIPNKDGSTPFHKAVSKGYKKIVNAMLDRGADVHARTANGDSPLHLAVRHCNYLSTEALLDRGALVNACNNEGSCPLHLSVINYSLKTTIILLDRGRPFVNVVDNEGWTPLHLAVRDRNRQLVALLISHGALTNLQNCWGHTALHTAVRNTDLTMVDILLSEITVLPDVRDMFGHTPLHYALGSNYPNLLFRLLRGGATINKDLITRTCFDHCPNLQHELTAFIIKLKIVGSAFPGCEFEGVWYESYSKLSASCFDEIDLLRKTVINNYPLYDVFCKKADLVTLHDAFKTSMDSAEFQIKFPNYAFIIRSVLSKAKKNIFHSKHAAMFFSFIHSVTFLPLLPPSVIKRILKHASDVDFQNLIACIEMCMYHKKVCQKPLWWFLYSPPIPLDL